MSKKKFAVRAVLTWVSMMVIVYLMWTGAQYVVTHKVDFTVIDYIIGIVLSFYFTRDLLLGQRKHDER